MKRLDDYRMRMVLVGVMVGIVIGVRRVKADFTWARMTDMPIKKVVFSTSVVGGKIYAIGGWHAIGEWNPQWEAHKGVDEYDPTTDTWTRKADMPTARGRTFTCVVNDKIYVLGGDAGSGPTSIVEVYDPATDTWTRKADMPTPRWMQSSCAANGKIYVIGGMTSGGATAAMEEYDPMTDTWTVKAPMPTPRYGVGTCFLEGKICVIGGWRHSINGPIYSTVEVYDPKTDIWTRGIDIPITTVDMSTSVVDDKIYVFGGNTVTHKNEHYVLTSAVYASDIIIDFNSDGIVDAEDMCIMVDHWGEDYSLCDIYPMPWGDDIVDVQDLIVLAEHLFEDYRLIAHWTLDEMEGIYAADSVGNNDAVVLGGIEWQPTGGKIDGALGFNGVDGCAITNTVLNPADGPFSVFAWIKGGEPGQVVISQQNGSNWLGTDPELGCLMTELMAPAVGRFTPQPMRSESVITDGQWHCIGLTWDGSNRTLYVDGIMVAGDIQHGLEGSQMGLYIGTGKDMEAGTYFSGLIDDIRIYNVALSKEEIEALTK